MTAVEAAAEPWLGSDVSHREWAELSVRAPQLAVTMRRYLVQLTTFLAPRSVEVADSTLRQLARWLIDSTDVTVVADITRTHFEDYKVWLAARPGTKSPTLAKNTQRQRLRMIRIFFERLIEWDWTTRLKSDWRVQVTNWKAEVAIRPQSIKIFRWSRCLHE